MCREDNCMVEVGLIVDEWRSSKLCHSEAISKVSKELLHYYTYDYDTDPRYK